MRPAIDTITTPRPRLGSMRQAKTRKARARSAGKEKAHRVTLHATTFSRRVSVRALLQASRKASPKREEWSAGRRQGRGPRHADGCYHPLALRARRAPQNDPLARTACFGRAAPPGAPPRLSPGRSTAAAQNRIRPADRWSPATAIYEGDSIRIFVTELMINVNKIVTARRYSTPSPRVRGVGWDEGASPLGSESRQRPLTRRAYAPRPLPA